MQNRKQYYIENKERIKERVKQYRANNKEKISNSKKEYCKRHPEKARNRNRKLRYSQISFQSEQYVELFNKQNGRCAICGKHQNELKYALCVDHNHINGNVRGLLCKKCNLGIGNLNDDINLLSQAINYLKEY